MAAAAEQQTSNATNPNPQVAAIVPCHRPPRRKSKHRGGAGGLGALVPVALMVFWSIIYYVCVFDNSNFISLFSDVCNVIISSLAVVGLFYRQLNIGVPVDPLNWQISQDTANSLFACLANTIGAAESVLRIAATGQDKRFFFLVVASLYLLSALGRAVSGATVALAGLFLFCVYLFTENSGLTISCFSRFSWKRDSTNSVQGSK